MARRRAPAVRQYMTRVPVEVDRCQTVAEAAELMAANEIRHIPVLRGYHLRGIVSQRDLLEAELRFGDAARQMTLEEICQADVLKVGPMEHIDEVAGQMLERKVGSAVVVDGGFVVGIFTTTDALRAIQALFGPSTGSSQP